MIPADPQTILIVDDHPLFRKGVIQLIQAAPEFRFVGEAPSGKEGIALAHSLHPDMILLDLNMKDMNGVEVLKAIKDSDLDSRVIMLTVSDQAEDLMAALQAGADGYLLKDMEPEDLMGQLAEAAQGKITISERLTQLLVASLREKNRPTGLAEAGLTEQESRILDQQANRPRYGHCRRDGESPRQASVEKTEPAFAGGSGCMGRSLPAPGQAMRHLWRSDAI